MRRAYAGLSLRALARGAGLPLLGAGAMAATVGLLSLIPALRQSGSLPVLVILGLSSLAAYAVITLTVMPGPQVATAIAYALRRSRKIIRGLKEGLTEEERYAVADHTVAQLKERGDPWRLNEEARTAKPPSR